MVDIAHVRNIHEEQRLRSLLTRISRRLQSEPHGIDRFSRLAPELLQHIFSLAHEQDKPTSPLSRSLRPFYDALKFSKIEARNWRRIRSLLETVTVRPALGSAVRNLCLVDTDHETPLQVADFEALFALLPNVRQVSISVSKSSSLEVVLPTRQGAETALRPSVKVLGLSCSEPHGAGYDAKVLGNLIRLPNLKTLLLDFPGSTTDQVDTSMTNVVLSGIEQLHLASEEASTVRDFLASFPRLRVLRLQVREATCNFSPALAGVNSCSGIHKLCLRGHPPLGWRFPEELAKFVALKTLSLDGNFAHVGPEAYGALCRVPITTLQVNKGCDISAAALGTLLGPRGSCPTLKVLQLDNLSAACPPNVRQKDLESGDFDLYNYALSSHEARRFLSRFRLPRWTPRFSALAYQRLARSAKSHRVILKGSTVRAHEIEFIRRELDEVVDRLQAREDADNGGRGVY